MNARLPTAVVLAVFFAVGLTACGERPQVVNYKQGKYQGKPDTPAWENDRFKKDKTAWEKHMTQRNLSQNEYLRAN